MDAFSPFGPPALFDVARLRRIVVALSYAALVVLGTACECGINENPPLGNDPIGIGDDDDTAGNPTYTNEDCDNDIDDDGDGQVDCGDPDCELDAACSHECTVAETISCGDIVTANNGGPGHTDAIESYGCTTWDESGPEYTFSFDPGTSEEVTAVLTVSGHGNLDVFVLEADETCDGTACVAYGASTVHWSADETQDYLIVVDGYAGGQDNFSLELLCPSGGGGAGNGIDEACNNLLDDDGDGYVDCDDTDCWSDPLCETEDCTNEIDDNGNLLIDCADPDCFGQPHCSLEQCYDEIDNDGDFLVDCDDTVDCAGTSHCIPEGNCADGLDGDGDGLIDCDDEECAWDADCMGEICNNGVDDDFDALVDCDDDSCLTSVFCNSEVCDNNVDDDGDGDIDCDDDGCGADAACTPVCTSSTLVECGDVITGDTSTGASTDVISTYGCTPANESGNEVAYRFVSTGAGEVTFTVDGLSADLDLFGLQELGGACDPGNCLDSSTNGGNNPESVTMTIAGGTAYYAVIDGWNNNNGPYTLNVACSWIGTPENCTNSLDDDGDGLVDCNDPDCGAAAGCVSEICSDGIDNDGDSAVDCADSDCVGSADCIAEDCYNNIDDDGDNLVDCDDPECSIFPACSGENCTDNIDNDGDGLIDCNDPSCTGDPACNPSGSNPSEVCDNWIDDDGDGAVDCDDWNCMLDPNCGGGGGEICNNNVDDDYDGYIDCDDFLCLFDLWCWFLEEDCDDGSDNDMDNAIDCADDDCVADSACIAEQCQDGVDNDYDGDLDCNDAECATDPSCLGEQCGNGFDDDGDGFVDCADAECSTDPNCLNEICSNGLDDDYDGFVDCADPECNGNPVCGSVSENCDNGTDDNGDGLVDCADPTCSSAPVCIPEICWNGTDDDGDLSADCDDAECFESPDCSDELCWNGVDDDGDTLVDCDDDQCAGWADCNDEICDNNVDDDNDNLVDCDDEGCIWFGGCIPEDCDNNIDDDQDGAVDCADSDCAAECTPTTEICNNGTDDDADGQVDCNDSDCDGMPACAEDCTNGTDDDSDGDVDCDDTDCVGVTGCNQENCANGLDDDGDGTVDCADTDCVSNSACIAEICSNGIDDDGDGNTDCADSECLGVDPACGEVCDNGVDDNGNGLIDCDDLADCEAFCDEDPEVGGVCIDVWELECGSMDSFSNWGSGSTNNIDEYGCSTWDETGPEYTYVFRPEASEVVTIDLSNESADTDIFVINDSGGCDGDNCLTYGDASASFTAAAGQTYYVVVDGYLGAQGTYDLEMTCPSTNEICDNGMDDDGDGWTDCDDSFCAQTLECIEVCQENSVLWCGSTLPGDTSSLGNAVNSYSCEPAWIESGGEYAYYFQAPIDQANDVTVSLSYGANIDLDVFVLADEGIPCNSESCIASGALTTTFESIAGADYWIVVDGYQGDSGPYDITVDCEEVADDEDCEDGIDNDGDLAVDCDDSDCAGSPLCSSSCASMGSITCGQTVSGDSCNLAAGATQAINGYPYYVGSFEGPEVAWEWLATSSGSVELALLNTNLPDINHDIFVLDGDNGNCLNTQVLPTGGHGFNSLEWEAVGGHTYYILLDGPGVLIDGDGDGAPDNPLCGPYEAILDCNPSP